jgi:hypothetical protein
MPRIKAAGAAVPTAAATTVNVYQLKITLHDIKPPIWRRALVPGDFTLYKLHQVIQAVFGWAGYHLYEFEIGRVSYGEPDPDGMLEAKNAKRYRLGQMVGGEGAKFRYTYDFGDNWEHDILVEKVAPPEPGVKYPRCVAGKRACPPDDCGGPWGYPDLLAAISDPEHPEHDEMLEWVGGEFDPEAFEVTKADAELDGLRK